MRAYGLINLFLVSSVTACLFGVATGPDYGDAEYQKDEFTLPPDTPETEEPEPLIYDFKEKPGQNPLTQPKSKLYLETPDNVKTDVKYNPATGNYDVNQTMGDQQYRPESYMTQKEYKDYVFKKQMRDYWRSRVAADELNERPRKGLIPPLKVNSELFDRIFGGSTVDIKPTGTAELIFGLTRNRTLNPAIPQRQQTYTNFDFNMRIQLNLIGKIGDKLKITTNYNTEASFDWENQVKVDYTGYEDDIIKKIEAGNVTLPLNSTLISGSQTLFGFKTQLQFGKLIATTVLSQQKGKKQEVSVQGGAQMQTFNMSADNYESNKHFFLGHYFRTNYDKWMTTLPVINTPVVITKVEVYLLGVNGSAEQTRNVVAFEDLAETDPNIAKSMSGVVNAQYRILGNPNDTVPDNYANTLYGIMTNTVNGVLVDRQIDRVTSILTSSTAVSANINNASGNYMDPGLDYNIIRNARRLNPSEYYLNTRTGFISLNQQLNNEQALAVSYQFTYNGKTYQVGEFSDQVPDNSKLLVCKLLKSSFVSVHQPVWRLMMKNVYALGAYNLNPQDFRLDVYYNNIETGVDIPYIPGGRAGGAVNGIQLIRVLGADRLSVNGDLHPDGVYDFIPGYTILTNNGRAYFPTAEPFGRGLEAKFGDEEVEARATYVFKELYDSTRTAATFLQSKDRFKIKGTYRSSSGSEISLNALNIPQGAVVVTANGVTLTENTDYTVDYTLGRVKIINDGILNSGATIKVSLESNSLFSVNQKSLMGTRLDYKYSRNLTVGSTLLRYSERPLTQKVSIGDEPVTNYIVGLDVNHKTEAPFLTRLLDKLPFYSTKEMSTITTRAEAAKLFPGNAAAIKKNGGNSYIDDFEGSISLIDIRGATSWFLASVPQGQSSVFKEASQSRNIFPGINRARFNWYNIDAMFTRDQGSTTPSYYTSKKLFSNNMWRQVFETELFPGKTPPNGQQVVLPVLDLLYYPSERGPYNYDVKGTNYSSGINVDGTLKDPKTRWGGIMRRLETNDFQAANVEYIQFWMMDPYNEDYNQTTDPQFDPAKPPMGDLYINIGNISEDIVKDGRMVYENGLPGPSAATRDLITDTTGVAIVPHNPPVINVFSIDNADRAAQDVGYDGMGDDQERTLFTGPVSDMQNGNFPDSVKQKFIADPSSDDYHFFRGDDYDEAQVTTLTRYSRYNNPQGNSPTQEQYQNANPRGGNYSTSASNTPNIEDINRDYTLSEAENYYQYHVRINPNEINAAGVGNNFMVDAFDGTADFSGVTKRVKWYQFKIPISQFEQNVNGMEGFNSIRFMRVYMRNFDRPVLLRLARFELVRSDWRRYQYDLRQPGEYIITDKNGTTFDVSAVSLQENSTKVPVNYVMPPDIQQQQNVVTTNLVLLNEQSLQARVCDLKDGDSRAVFKNVDLDTRMFNNIKMNVHCERLNDIPLNDGELEMFFRVGSDYNNNYYEYSYPVKLTPKGVYDPNSTDDRRTVWPAEDEVNLKFADITALKDARNRAIGPFADPTLLANPFVLAFSGYSLSIVGNPNLGNVKSIMVGVRNPKNDGKSHCMEFWINELRLTDFNNKGGWAATAQVQAKLADLGVLNASGTYKTPFWGSVESKINDRSKETNLNWDVSTSINAGKFFPDKWKVTLPVFYNYGRTVITPLFNPLEPDVRTTDFKNSDYVSDTKKDSVLKLIQDFTQRRGFNLSNVRIDGLKRPKAKPLPWDISNFTATYAFNEIYRRNTSIEYNYNRTYRANLQYAFSIKSPPVFKPFDKVKLFQKRAWAIIKDFNIQLLPNSFGFSTDLNRTYVAQKNRDITSFYGGASDFVNPALVNKNFTITRSYNFRWDISKSIKYDFTASNDGRIREPYGESKPGDKTIRDYVIHRFLNGGQDTTPDGKIYNSGKYGDNTVYRQQMNLNVDVPINKIPILDFIKTSYRFSGTYTWTRRPFAATSQVGNTIQNTGNQSITANLNLTTLYNKIPYFKKLNNPAPPQRLGPGKPTDTKKPAAKDSTKKDSPFKDVGEFLARAIIMIKNFQVNYNQTRGQELPNFNPSSQYLGMDFRSQNAPGLLFTTGLYDANIRQNAIKNNWLTQNTYQTSPYRENYSTSLNYKSTIEPHGSLRIELNGSYTKSESQTSYIIYNPNAAGSDTAFRLNQSPNITGNYNITTMTFFKSFRDGKDPLQSELFKSFVAQRADIANLLTAKNPEVAKSGPGYSLNQQDVLLETFNRVYVGRDVPGYSTKHIFYKTPLPNWTVSWDGLGKIKALKKTFKGIIIRHGYKNTYSLSGYSNNLLFNNDGVTQDKRVPQTTDTSAGSFRNFVPFYQIASVTMSERFDPLIKFDFQFQKPGWTANLEFKRDKTTTLNLTGFQIIETRGQEIVVGLGYLYPNLKIKKIKIQGKPLESNLTVKVDFSYRKNASILRQINDGTSVPTAGSNILTLRSSANYQLTQNITLRLFLDWIKTIPQTSATFRTSNINGGFSLLITFS